MPSLAALITKLIGVRAAGNAGLAPLGLLQNAQLMTGTIFSATAIASIAGTNSNTLQSFTLGNSVVNANGKGLRFTAFGSTGSGTSGTTLTITVGGTAVASLVPGTASGTFMLQAVMLRTGSNASQIGAIGYESGAGTNRTFSTVVNATGTHAANWNGSNTVAITGISANGSNGATLRGFVVEVLNG
jgi:hypothetical protein